MIEDGLQYGRYDNPQIFVSSFIKHPDVIVVGNNDDGKGTGRTYRSSGKIIHAVFQLTAPVKAR